MHVSISDLSFSYPGTKEYIVSDFSLHMKEGEILSILGESGSGKSTILRLLAGLEEPVKGTVRVGDKVFCDHGNVVLPVEKRGIGMVFQDYALFPHMTVEANITFGLKRWRRRARKERLEEMLALIGMEEYKKRYPFELSGGQQQRIALARALAPNPSLLLLDEPFSNLDAHLQHRIRAELRETIKQTGTTTLFVTHDQEDARVLADRVVMVEKGTVQKAGRPSEVFKDTWNEKLLEV
ncbi:iron(III) transport system ATP-binding protein [Alteribacillus persepolensis]|uniref:Carnitine transport ATP-binding protein OpuCA n=1 Tax=Alteribacillus persepolensis TaxID=568899 RepID=A0A1G8G4E1_9BACI|nr:ABC transporter ATP-binding protein [Alteribacillus persepolensis]SDH89197.1 iron(III) transport system ATP-binding protein [Alteribacillus persepolensis]